jgi:hypothetical protein
MLKSIRGLVLVLAAGGVLAANGEAISQDGMDPAALSRTFAGRGPGTD